MNTQAKEEVFYVASLSHTSKDEEFIVWWMPQGRGYTRVVTGAGKYTTAEMMEYRLNDGVATVAIPVEVAESFGIEQPCFKTGERIFSTDGLVVPNSLGVWREMKRYTSSPVLPKPDPYRKWPERFFQWTKPKTEAELANASYPKLEKNARVGGVVFGVGVSSRLVVEEAQDVYRNGLNSDDAEDAACFRYWIREAKSNPGALAVMLAKCVEAQDYRDVLMPLASADGDLRRRETSV